MGFDQQPKRSPRLKNLTLAGIAGLAGCWIVVLVFGAMFLGLWLDAQLGMRGPFTIGLVVLSIPVTLTVAFRIVLRLLASIQPPPRDADNPDTSTRGG
jgi:hypothetical protein